MVLQQFVKKNTALGLVAGAVVMMLTAAPAAAERNPFALMSEAELATNANLLQEFWQQQVTTGSATTKDGTALYYAYYRPPHARATVVIVTGRTEAIAKYQELFYEFGRLGYAVLGYDHRGQGQSARLLSDTQIGHVEQFDDYVEDLHVILTQLNPLLPQDKVLLAHSMGGAVASVYLAKHPKVFKAAALSAPMNAPNTELVFTAKDGCYLQQVLGWTCPDCYAGFASSPYENTAFASNIYSHSEVRYQRFRTLFQQQPQLQLGGPSWQWLGQACEVAENMPDIAANIKVPVKILQAGADVAVRPEAQELFCKNLGTYCAGSAVFRVDGARHEILFEADQFRTPALTEILRFYQQQLAL